MVTVSSDPSLDFSAFNLIVSFVTADNTIAGASVSLGWSGIFFPNGSLPATLPPISGSFDPFMVVDVNFAETDYTPDSVSGCSLVTSPPPPPTLPAPSIKASGIVPVGSAVPTIQSGEWVSIYGTNLANSTTAWNGDFPTFLGGTSVTINGKSAYLSFVSAGQINVQAPTDTATAIVPVVVTTACGSSEATVRLAQFGPSFFLIDDKHVAGIIVRSDGSGAYGVVPTFSGLSGAGVYQINLTVPEGLGTGDVSLVATVGGKQTPPAVVISLQ